MAATVVKMSIPKVPAKTGINAEVCGKGSKLTVEVREWSTAT